MEILTEPAKKYVDSDIKFKVKLPAYETRRVEGTFLDETDTIEDGKTLITYKGNTSQEGTPTPDNPINVDVVTGYNKVVVSNKNLLHLPNNTKTHAGITGVISDDNIITYNGTATGAWANITDTTTETLPIGTYTFSIDHTTSNNERVVLYLIGSTTTNVVITGGTTSRTITTTEVKTSYRVGITNTITNSFYSGTFKMQLEVGSTATDYIQHQEQEYEVNLDTTELCKIGTYQDRIYRQNGTWYLHKEIQKVILNGSENWDITNTGTPNWYYSRIDNTINIINDSTINNSMCDHYPFGSVGNSNTNEGYYIVKSTKQIRIRYGTEDTIANFKTWLSSNNVTLYYVLNESTDTEITNQALINQLEQIWENLKTYEGETIISQVNSDLPFYLDVLMEI